MEIIKNYENNTYSFLRGGGEMGEIIRSYDWASTSMGVPDLWPQSLKTTLGIMLRSAFPMFLWWGDDLICFYNDAYRPSLGIDGKHPAVGKKANEVWSDIWDFIGPLIDKVLYTGESVWYEDQLVPIYRNGRTEDVYWTFSYSPVDGDEGAIDGVLVTCTETTGKVKNMNKLIESENRFQHLIRDATIGMIVMSGDELTVQIVNKAYGLLIGQAPENIIGKRIFDIIPETEAQFRGLLDQVKTTEEPIFLYDHPYFVWVNGLKKEGFLNIVYQPFREDSGKMNGIVAMCQDVTEQVISRKRLEESERQFKLMADSVVQMIWITDPLGMHEYYNKRWYEFTGTSVEDTAGERWNKMFHPDDRERAWKKWRHSLKTGDIYEIEYRLLRKDGEYVWVLGRAAPLYNSDGEIIRWFGTCTDIDDQKRLQQQKEEFISIASHELKTPLTSLNTSLQFLERQIEKEANLNPLTLKMVELANKNAKKLAGLVKDLLDFTKLEKGQLILRKSTFTLSDLLNSSCETTRMDGFKVKVNGDSAIKVSADYLKIEQVIINLLNNCVKYASQTKEIIIHYEQMQDNVKVSVQDFGPGIPKEKLSHLFTIYYRADKNGQQYSGLGLGLYICSRIISDHDGKIGVESELGKGTTFWFTIPI
ncbi:MAG TPA: PAS domain-containing protein [Pedobacter sp.]|jgi:two-component system CheB/CheR fusion protein